MENDSNIRTLQSSNFLKEGAFVRWKGRWFVFQGPFEKLDTEESPVLSIACMGFFDPKTTCFQAEKQFSVDSATWQDVFKPEPLSCSFHWRGPSRDTYAQSFALVQAQIHSANWNKAVPIAFDHADETLDEAKKKYILSQIANAPDSLIPYGFWKDGVGMIGITPEILFFRKERMLSTMALAGTEKKMGPCRLLEDQKNLKEHDFVVQELFEKLRSFGKVESQGPAVLELPTLYHLLTHFSVQLEETVDDLQLLKEFHPTSALGISPYKKWRQLETLPEQKQRHFFGSPFFLRLGKQESLALVALRQIQWDENQVRIGAGGGVVQESQEQLEWLEILAKIESVKKLMGIS